MFTWLASDVGQFGVLAFVIEVVILRGEMIVVPRADAGGRVRADRMRGRYMAVFGLSFSAPAAIGPLAAGIVLDNYPPNLLWYLSVLLCAVSASGFYALHLKLGAEPRFASAATRPEHAPLAMEAEHG